MKTVHNAVFGISGNLIYGMNESPCNKMPTCPMPQAADDKDDENVNILPQQAFAASAQRDIEIIRKPRGQGNMPSAPKLFC